MVPDTAVLYLAVNSVATLGCKLRGVESGLATWWSACHSLMSQVYTCFVCNSLFAVFPYLLGLILFIGYVPKLWFTDHQWSVSLMQAVHGTQTWSSQWKQFMFILVLMLLLGAFVNTFQLGPVSLSVGVDTACVKFGAWDLYTHLSNISDFWLTSYKIMDTRHIVVNETSVMQFSRCFIAP